jgi:hypothetical protein
MGLPMSVHEAHATEDYIEIQRTSALEGGRLQASRYSLIIPWGRNSIVCIVQLYRMAAGIVYQVTNSMERSPH